MDSKSQSKQEATRVPALLEIALLLYISAMITITLGAVLSAFIRAEAIAPTHILAAFVYPVPLVCSVLFVIAAIRRVSTAVNNHAFSRLIVNMFLLMVCFGALEGFSAAVGGPLGFIGNLVILVLIGVALFSASQKEWMPKPASLIPGLLIGMFLVGVANAIINLLIYDIASNPTRFLLFSIMNVGAIGVTISIAGLFEGKRKYGLLIGLLSLFSALILMYVNRVYLLSVPKYYAHISLAFFEWMAVFGFFSWTSFHFRKGKYAYYITGGLVLIGVISLVFFDRNPEAPIPRRLDPSADLYALPWEVFDFDRDGFLSPRLGGLDCQEWNPEVHPLAADLADVDRNCNGVVGEVLVGPKKNPLKMTADLMLLITIDQLRPDRMSVYGYSNKTTPNLDELTDEFVRFDNAYAPGGITTLSLPSFNSNSYIMSSAMKPVFRTTRHRYVDDAAALDEGEFLDTPFLSPVPSSTKWISASFRKRGDRAVALIDDHGQRLPETVFRMNAVFDRLENVKYSGGSSADRLTKAGIEELKNNNPGYLWMHYYDPHSNPRVCKMFEYTGSIGCYDESIFEIDRQLGILFSELKRSGKWDSAFIAITSDHGEAFGEHRFRFHGLNSHEESAKVPLLVKFPKGSQFRKEMGSVVTQNVSALDAITSGLVATGLPANGHGHPLEDASTRTFPILSYRIILDPFGRPFEQNVLLVEGDLRVFYDRVRGTTRVFSLDKDPQQMHPYFDEKAQRRIFEAIDKVGLNGIP